MVQDGANLPLRGRRLMPVYRVRTLGRIRQPSPKRVRERSENTKTVRKTTPKTVKALNQHTNFRNVRHICRPFFTRLAKWHESLVRPRRLCGSCAKAESWHRKPPRAATCEYPSRK